MSASSARLSHLSVNSAIEEDKTCALCKGVMWLCRGVYRVVVWIGRGIYRFFDGIKRSIQDWHLARTAEKISRKLDNLEQHRICFTQNHEQPINFSLELTKALEHRTKMENCRSESAIRATNSLTRKTLGLLYRLGNENGGLEPTENDKSSEFCLTLENLAKEWKQGKELYETKELTQNEKDKLEEAASYTEFADLLTTDALLRNRFFSWIMPNSNEWQTYQANDVASFVQFPSAVDRIHACFLTSRLQSYKGKGLKIELVEEQGAIYKDLTLPFEKLPGETKKKRKISILDPERVVDFVGKNKQGNLSLKIKDVFQSFYDKQKQYGPLEFLRGKIALWDALELGYWNEDQKEYNKVDLRQKKWWEQFPRTDRLSIDKARARYKKPFNCADPFDYDEPGENWIIAPRFTRQSVNNELAGHHGYFEIAIPKTKEGRTVGYDVRSFGMLAKEFPVKFSQYARVVAQPVQVAVSSPDENRQYSHREHVGFAFAVPAKKAVDFMDSVKDAIQLAFNGEQRFQLLYKNCLDWVLSLIEKHALNASFEEQIMHDNEVPDAQPIEPATPLKMYPLPDFTIDFLRDIRPSGLAGKIIRCLRRKPEAGEKVLSFALLVFGSWRSAQCQGEEICFRKNTNWKRFIYPPMAFVHKANGLIDHF